MKAKILILLAMVLLFTGSDLWSKRWAESALATPAHPQPVLVSSEFAGKTLAWAGTGVVMGNAEPELLDAGFHKTLTNDEAGLARAIDRFGTIDSFVARVAGQGK